jgi:dTDP-4-amino-4,6-dideoxygalactose transaminase
MIPVTKPYLPPKEEFDLLISQIWERNWLTNNGPIVNELELELKEYLELEHLLFLGNGTLALQVAIKALGLNGEVITTPFSYIATTSSILWEGLTPVFVDIDERSFNIDVDKIERAITPNTSAILATHVFGNPCDIPKIEKIAKKHNLKVIYDAAHCFGTKFLEKSVLNFGDISTISFHATKLYHTVEGGAVITGEPELLKKMSFCANFGHHGPTEFAAVGINAKNSEFHAAMGVVNLRHVNEILIKRKNLSEYYKVRLADSGLKFQQIFNKTEYNYAYFPVVFDSEQTLILCLESLNAHRVYPRRYFYPSLNLAGLTETIEMPVSESISKRIMCLPLYHTLSKEEIDLICRVILRCIKYQEK